MAGNTQITLRNQVMYSVFVRQFSKEGTFAAVQAALPRIRALGVDVIWLMPIHPIGEACRKGTLGSPYAIRDYRAINPELGTMADFVALVEAIHAFGMKCIIDVVYNHTSPDSVLAQQHPDWFYHKADGTFGNKIGDWSDIIDLDYRVPALWTYQIQTLRQWAHVVDGFRCDVAPLIPLAFWQQARQEVEQVRPGCLWLSESVEPSFTLSNRARGMVSLSDAEIFQAFDVCYDYDIHGDLLNALTGNGTLATYADAINRQAYTYPANYVKLRFLENHDRPRAAWILPDTKVRHNWTALMYFQQGMTLLYAGQEIQCVHRPSLFDRDPIDWASGYEHTEQYQTLYAIKQDAIFAQGMYTVKDAGNGMLLATYTWGSRKVYGVFSTRGETALVAVDCQDGKYHNQLNGAWIQVEGGLLPCHGEPMIWESAVEAV